MARNLNIKNMAEAYFIRNKATGEQWVAYSGKQVWAKPGHAKLAWAQTSVSWAKFRGMPVRPAPTHYRPDAEEVVPFNEQDLFEVVKLETKGDIAIDLLTRCLGRLTDRDLEKEIEEFLK